MALASIRCHAQLGIQAPEITVEVHLSNGLPKLSIVGLPETAVKESRDRVRSAILNSQLNFPNQRTTINLAPADLPKEGSRYDLPIAIGILAASGQLPAQALQHYAFAGELTLSGELRPIRGALPIALRCAEQGIRLILPAQNATEAAFIEGIQIYPAKTLLDVCRHFLQETGLTPIQRPNLNETHDNHLDIRDIKGQSHAKRALLIAAAGGHNLLMAGPPGTGKTMLANRLPGLLPPLTQAQAVEVASIASIQGLPINPKTFYQPPFRRPHHTASAIALVGGGSNTKPGEISLAHQGVLFLDELPEFDRHVLEVLREPLESGSITISRANRHAEYPARFQLIAALNPCPCGYHGATQHHCQCSYNQIQRYLNKLSGPLLDRIDLHIQVPELPQGTLSKAQTTGPDSAALRQKVITAQHHQRERQKTLNRDLSGKQLNQYAALTPKLANQLDRTINQLKLSNRAYHRIIRIARTIADLEQVANIAQSHLDEAILYRQLALGK